MKTLHSSEVMLALASHLDATVKRLATEKARAAVAQAAIECGTTLAESEEFKAALQTAIPKVEQDLYAAFLERSKRRIDAVLKEVSEYSL